jgi:hypothetical protein
VDPDGRQTRTKPGFSIIIPGSPENEAFAKWCLNQLDNYLRSSNDNECPKGMCCLYKQSTRMELSWKREFSVCHYKCRDPDERGNYYIETQMSGVNLSCPATIFDEWNRDKLGK